ncbi:sensor histidine kinase [Methylobacterium radiodurans]|uniref:histidine kinase n=1 Tax=Methylobacterium radiodurans TaxID=2202828 RepID=A0A2U8VUZ5_9HYPH|nr:HAMP domain-containing sensor histidine kinase [Methylobacterium radiodurans]AWN36956.1 histidine kinase [Methylobacterium radiodurans]
MRVRAEEGGALQERGSAAPAGRGSGLRLGLSARLFLITVAFVAVAEVLIYVPAVANYRLSLLSDRIAAAQVAAMVLDASQGQPVADDLARHLLVGAGARVIAVRGDETQRLLSLDPVPERVADTVDLRNTSIWEAIRGGWRTIVAPADAPIRVVGHGRDGFDLVEVLIDEAPLRQAIVDFALRLLLSSLIVAAAAAGVVFVVLQVAIVRPVRRLARNIAAFADDPEGAERGIVPSRRTDEIGVAETALARMAQGLADQLRQKKRLAELGLAVSKINHELRNMLTAAQLLGDRLEGAADPTVQRVAPRLLATLDRAIRFCEATLAYGRASEPSPSPRRVALAPLLAELEDLTGLADGAGVAIRVEAPPDLTATVDPEQLARALTNLVRNAVQALASDTTSAPEVRVTASRGCVADRGAVTILVADNGPGLPERARAHLFAPFKGSTRAGGTGLGLAVASELIRLNGGSLTLDAGTRGACFRVTLPDAA